MSIKSKLKLKKMKIHVNFSRGGSMRRGDEITACVRLRKPGRSPKLSKHSIGRDDAICSTASSPRAALRASLVRLTENLSLGRRAGHKRFHGS